MRGHAKAPPTIAEMLESRKDLLRASRDFLKIDLETALIFAKSARETTDNSRRKRNVLAARKAYNVLTKLSSKVDLSLSDKALMKRGLNRLKAELEQLGEIFGNP